MERDERNIYIKGITLCAVFIILAVYLYTLPARAKKGAFEASDASGEYFIAEEAEMAKTGQIRESTASGMPCDNPEQFERWLETYEQEASEEEITEGLLPVDGRGESDGASIETEQAEVETEAETVGQETIYAINGEVLNPELQAYLYQRLVDHGIEWFMPYAIMMAYQESHFDCTAVNRSNLRDMGLFQFRINYYPGQDIFNPYEQIDIFTEQMANRANSGRTVSEMISAHNVSDYGGYNQTYVDQVLSHSNNLREVK